MVVIKQHGIRDLPETAQVRIIKPPTCKFQCLLVTVALLPHPLKSLIKRSFIKDEINSTKLVFFLRELYFGAGKVAQLYCWATRPDDLTLHSW